MQVVALIFGVVLLTVAGLNFLLAAKGAKETVKRNAPAYAQRLFSGGLEAFFTRNPVRLSVLFGEPIPPEAKEWVQPIRVAAAIYLGLFVIFVLGIVAHLVTQ